MKLTKKLEAEILKAYNTIWDAYLKGDMRVFASMLDENCYIIGSAAGEVFSNKKAAVKYYKSTAEQITGKAELRNRKINVMAADKGFMVNEESVFYLLIDDQWTFYGPVRISSLLHKKNNKWKVVHQHGSFPDSKTEGGEQVNTEKIKAENIQLRDAVKRRTVELEQKNQELAIEASLEKVRAQALGMHKPDDLLNVCKVLFKELSLIGFSDIRNAVIHTFHDDGNYLIDYDYSDLIGGIITTIPYSDQPVIRRFLNQIRKSNEAFAVVTVKGKELKEWKKFRKSGGQPDDPRLDKTDALYYYFHSVGTADIGISAFSSVNEEKLQLLKRFRNVFDLAYKRYTDITKAEAQSREGQIQLALERVRARTMAMHKSDELREAVLVIYEQLKLLNFESSACNIIILDKESGSAHYWVSGFSQEIFPVSYDVPYLNHPYQDALLEPWKQGDKYVVYEYTGKMKQNFDEIFFTQTDFRNVPVEAKNIMIGLKSVMLSTAFMTYGALQSLGAEPLSDENANILQRFAKVFEQTYTRFLDLQKAEAQAREADIELSLERVRAKTMAMQKPSEFVDVINIIGEQFVHLGFDIDWVNFGANGLEISKGIDIWNFAVIPGAAPISARVFIPYFDHPVFTTSAATIHKFLNGGKDLITVTLDKQTKDTWLDHLFTKTIFQDVPEEYRIIQYAKPGYTTSNISLKDTWLSIGKFDIKNFTDEQHAILRRFANAFGQAYTRFLDLQKAEAQAREAQIEASLERVRSRAMAMQTSEELNELIGTVFTELTKLDLVLTRCVILIYEGHEKGVRWWMANSEAPSTPMNFFVKYANLPFFNSYLKGWQQRSLKWQYVLEGEDKIRTDKFLFSETELSLLPDFVIAGMKANNRVYLSASFNNYGCLNLASLEPLSDEHFDILLRFAKVFDLTYTRFNDLKQAEAQAKEARIQLALERVRARTMAMQKSEELAEAAQLLYEEFRTLGIKTYLCGYLFFKEEQGKQTAWVTAPDGILIPDFVDFPLEGDSVLDKRYADWKQKKPLHVLELQGEANKEHHRFLASKVPDPIANEIFSTIPHRIIFYCANFSAGYLFIIATEFLTKEEEEIIIRFAKVFELTYTRFNDLKQAEAQAREAKIEAALERVRARAMAMHESQELKDVALELRNQMGTMAQPELEVCAIHLYDESTEYFEAWAAIRPPGDEGNIMQLQARFPKHGVRIVDEMMKAYYEGKKDYVLINEGEKLREWFDQLKEQVPEGFKMVLESLHGIAPQDSRTYWSHADFEGGSLVMTTYIPPNEDARKLLRRFSNVFGLAYRRFVDLKQAEAQARESELELALERVRAKSMSMRHSDELSDLVKIVFKELTRIGFPVNACIIMTYDERTNDSTWWIANIDGVSHPVGLFVPNHSHEPYLAYLNEWKKQTTKWRYKLGGAEKKKWDQYLFKNSGLATLPDLVKQGMQSAEDVHLNVCFNKYASITFGSFEPMSDKDFDTVHRFAKVFEQSYTRFLDLQKAEAQAREAHIETALERVRARTMGMHQSKELHAVIETVTNQLRGLGLEFDNSVFCRINQDESWEMWMSTPQQSYPSIIYVPYLDHRIFNNLKDVKAKNLEFYTDVFEQDEARVFFKHFFENTIAKDVSEERKQYVLSSRGMARSLFLTKDIWFVISRYSPDPFNDEENGILKRFAKVFEQAYIRFLDLEKAEAQANEARIEIALERIRARALAMHKSDELMEVAKVLREQMALLGQPELEASVVHLYEIDPDHVHSWRAVSIGTNSNTQITRGYMAIPKNSCELVREWVDKFYSDLKEYTIELTGARQQEWYDVLSKLGPDIVDAMRKENSLYEKRYYRFSKFSGGALLMISKQEPSAEVAYLQKRAAVVFDLAYRRFSDLQKAEAQARDAQIESSLERVRSKTMAMHNSQDVGDTVASMFDELIKLGVETVRCGIGIIHEHNQMELWTARKSENEKVELIIGRLDMTIHPLLQGVHNGWKNKDMTFSYELKGIDLVDYFTKLVNSPDYHISYDIASLPQQQFHNAFYFPEGALFAFSAVQLSTEASQIFKRFAGVFGQTYRRYLDLQKAEAQAREAKIEASLERVRAKAMAMHKSEDLNAAVAVVFEELDKLDLGVLRCGISILDKEKRTGDIWVTSITDQGSAVQISGDESFDIHPLLHGAFEAWLRKEDFSYLLQGDDLTRYYEAVKSANFQLPESQMISSASEYRKQYCYAAVYGAGGLFAFRDTEFSDEAKKVMRRFAVVFDLTYKRFLDLQKAEANAKEAQIEAGLERVRARTMAMHSSEDVSMATATMFTELEKLGIENFRGGITNILINRTQDVWSVNNLAEGKILKAIGTFNIDAHPFWQLMFNEWHSKKDFTQYFLAGKEKEEYVRVLNSNQGYLPQAIQEFPDVHFQVYYFNEGAVWTNSLQPHSEENKQVMKRFASVFSLTFRRYQDLKKAEAQAREATIEAALEKVRGKAMAMHNSNDLSVTTSMIISELRKLGISPIRCGVGIIDKESFKAQLYTATSSADGDSLSVVGWALLKGHPVLEQIYEKWLAGKDYFPELSGDSRKAYYEQLLAGLSVPLPDFKDDQKHYGHFFAISVGCLYAWADVKYNDDEIKILRRFASIVDLTFRRYFELQKSEENAREAVKQAALDRIRADIASMRTISDLDRITPLIWNELIILGIPFIRCGVFIMDEEQQLIHTFLSTPDGKAIAAFHLPYDTPGNVSHVLTNWKINKNYIDRWAESEFKQFADILVKQGTLASAEQYLKTIPKGGFYLHFLPFLQGMLYVGNTDQLNEEQIEMIQHVADAFSTAYARYEDFNKLEAAKQQVEKTLTDLKQAQTQLVQSEKMASLGELTAGIAHEIQNPLNFVNNFSDVSSELLEEMKTELEKGNKEDAIAIVEDVKQNLEKILHHGKRADAIVKGMLQHSRTSSGQKEPTDINVLADEYLRLAFHGLRAKDKSFNAKFETDFDNSIGKINVIPQDIGRVVLNLINNAFYAVTEKKKQNTNGYDPVVTVTTKKDNGKIEIKVKDNGNGIPQKVLDKIFQPFFTTKPTGQGTGLGLSLAYDIVTKGHNGELKVETKEGEGSEFIIQLQIQ